MNKHQNKTAQDDPIDKHQVALAIQKSGYPFEVELFQMFEAGGMEPVVGRRMRVEEAGAEGGSFKDIDLDVRFTSDNLDPSDGAPIPVLTGANVLVQAKVLHAPARLAGIVGHRPSREEEVRERAHFAGVPAGGRGTLQDAVPQGGLLFGDHGLAECLDPLLDAPYCVHLAVVRRVKAHDFEPRAQRDPEYHDDLQSLVGARYFWSREFSLGLLEESDFPPTIRQIHLLLVADTPEIFTYNPITRQLVDVQRLCLRQSFTIADVPQSAVIDIVTKSGALAMIAAYKESAVKLQQLAVDRAPQFRGLAMGLRKRYSAKQKTPAQGR
jgi:hypothetical protein